MTADACGREVIAGPVEAAALGNAMAQAVATGHLSSVAEGRAALRQFVELRTYEPVRVDEWRLAFERYKSVVARGRNSAPASMQT
jgi:sugar (pentulose or hexulose) kinase